MTTTKDDWLAGSTILVTGASGRVGQRLVSALLDAGARVRTVVLPDDPGLHRIDPLVQVVSGSLASSSTVRAAVDGVDAVVHLAALMDWGPRANDRLFASNVTATYLLLEALSERATEIRRVVVVSSDEVYPALDVTGEITEDLPLRPYSFYGLTKQLDEVLAEFYGRMAGLPVTTARFSLTAEASEITRHDGWSGRLFFASGLRVLLNALGRSDAIDVLDRRVDDQEHTLVLARDEAGAPYRFQFCDVRDLVHGLMCLLTSPDAVRGVFNLSGPSPFDYSEVVPRLSAAIGVPYVTVALPGPRFDVRINTARAQESIGFRPKYDIDAILQGLTE